MEEPVRTVAAAPAHLVEARPALCPNCESPTTGNFCATCGQKNGDLRPTMRELLRDITRYAFRIDGKFLLTLRRLARPGFLTREYLAGRRERYERPFRFYLVINVAFFLVVGAVRTTAFDATSTARLLTGFQDTVTRFDERQAERIAAGEAPRPEPRPIRYARSIINTAPEELQARLHQQYQRWGPKVFLAVIPITALMLTLVYRRRGLRFAEHFVFCLHYQAFSTLVTLPAQLTGTVGAIAAAGLVDMAYLYLSMKRVYGDGWWGTAWRFAWVYGFAALTLGTASTALILAATLSAF